MTIDIHKNAVYDKNGKIIGFLKSTQVVYGQNHAEPIVINLEIIMYDGAGVYSLFDDNGLQADSTSAKKSREHRKITIK